jgi:hypothetical protein
MRSSTTTLLGADRTALTRVTPRSADAPASSDAVTARSLQLELHRWRADLLKSDEDAADACKAAAERFAAVDMATLPNLDAKIVASLLSFLTATFPTPAAIAGHPLNATLDAAVAWVVTHAATLPGAASAAAAHAVLHFGHPQCAALTEQIAPRLILSMVELPSAELAKVAFAYAHSASPQAVRVLGLVFTRLAASVSLATTVPAADLALIAAAVSLSDLGISLVAPTLQHAAACVDTASPSELLAIATALTSPRFASAITEGMSAQLRKQLCALPPQYAVQVVLLGASRASLHSVVAATLPSVDEAVVAADDVTTVMGLVNAGVVCNVEVPAALLRRALATLDDAAVTWTAAGAAAAVIAFSGAAAHEDKFFAFVERLLQQRHKGPAVVNALLSAATFEKFEADFATFASSNVDSWTPDECGAFLAAASQVSTAGMRKLVRGHMTVFTARVETAPAPLLDSMAVSVCERLHIRHDAFCAAVATRSAAIKAELSASALANILGALASVDVRQSSVFLDVQDRVAFVTSMASARDVATLTAAYAGATVWNYKLYARLAERMIAVGMHCANGDMLKMMTALHRVDVVNTRLTQNFVATVATRTAGGELTTAEMMQFLSAFSKLGAWDLPMFNGMAARFVEEQQQLNAVQLGEVLLSFSRVGLEMRGAFDALSLRAIALAPTAPPLAVASFTTAFAAMRIRNVELFTILGERALQLREDCPSLTVSAVLIAFATVGIRNDKLFIEMIPRVRHVAHHGSPQDVANVLSAYTAVSLWHYKLFVRLAERAVAVRADCKVKQVAQILAAFAKVDMKQEKLFTEMSPRLQTLIPTAQPGELASLAHSYAALRVNDGTVFNMIAERSLVAAAQFEPQEARDVLAAFKRMDIRQEALTAGLAPIAARAAEVTGQDVKPGTVKAVAEEAVTGAEVRDPVALRVAEAESIVDRLAQSELPSPKFDDDHDDGEAAPIVAPAQKEDEAASNPQ